MTTAADTWPLPEALRSDLDRFLSDAINLTAGEYLMQQGRMTREQAMRDMFRRVAALEEASSQLRRSLNDLGEVRLQERQVKRQATRRRQRVGRKARRGW